MELGGIRAGSSNERFLVGFFFWIETTQALYHFLNALHGAREGKGGCGKKRKHLMHFFSHHPDWQEAELSLSLLCFCEDIRGGNWAIDAKRSLAWIRDGEDEHKPFIKRLGSLDFRET
ncbi:hypothetical protein CERZMDRAFT_120196 [Cercospora zeae-maydis SCOH1-5]|uniref:Uncharacterized protein n=1 Tax=Cercospora zeae-maydis SCOH1-5 TaxID=717836 RepID=A0A6A6FP04_9PEZI|nr:hypothetical protein CERZMDRAFT_120196 [Cercospora zeae-maydis SCOH1-5]